MHARSEKKYIFAMKMSSQLRTEVQLLRSLRRRLNEGSVPLSRDGTMTRPLFSNIFS